MVDTFREGTKVNARVLGALLFVMLIVPFAAPSVIVNVTKPKPSINTSSGKVLARPFVLSWSYDDDKGYPLVKYEIIVEEKLS